MFARVFGKSEPKSNRPRNAARLGVEWLEDRSVPAIVSFNVNVPDDTPFVQFGFNPNTFQMAPLDANNNTSLRAVVEYGNANPQIGNWGSNRYEANLGIIAGGTITLTQNTTLVLDTNFNILANGANVTIERSAAPNTPAFRLLSVAADTESHFVGIKLQNGDTVGSGGAIRNAGKVQLMSCTFTENVAGFDGGAIVTLEDATTILFSCTFTDNSAGRDGGAIAALPGSLTTSLNTCTLTENETVARGGAVFAEGAGSLFISGSSITNNKTTGVVGVQGLGGGVYVETTASATINHTNITNNTAAWRGGGLYVLNCDLTMTYGSLSYNTASQDGGGFYIDADTKTVTLNNVSVTQNTATNGKGGGGYILKGTLAGSLSALTGNTAGLAILGIGVKVGAIATITVPPGQQTVVNDP